MKAINIQARTVLNVCHFYGIKIESHTLHNQHENKTYFVITGDVGSYALLRLHEAAEKCSMVLVLEDSKLTIQYTL